MYKPGLISVIMSAYNAETFIEEAIYGVLNQTYTNFELLIINDGSSDNTENIIQKFQDTRIKYFSNQENKGNHFSRNLGLEAAAGEFIAIMDSDDIPLPHWLDVQINFLQNNKDIDAVSCGLQVFENEIEKYAMFPPGEPEFIKAFLFFKNCVHQPGIVFRLKSFEENKLRYQELNYIEDYDLWLRASLLGLKFSSSGQVLVKYRISPIQESSLYHHQRQENLQTHFKGRLKKIFSIEPEDEKLIIIANFISTRIKIKQHEYELLSDFLTMLYKKNQGSCKYNSVNFNAVLYFFFLRLGKYHFLDYKKQPLQFLKYFAEVVYMLGLKSLTVFLRNRKYL